MKNTIEGEPLSGGAVLLKKHGPDYFKKLAKKRWKSFQEKKKKWKAQQGKKVRK